MTARDDQSPAARSPMSWWVIAALTAATIFAAVVRLRGIDDDSLWGDEALSWIIARMSLPDLVRYVIFWEQIPPVHHLVLWVTIRLFGASELTLRLPSALAGIAAVPAIFFFVRRLIGQREALAAAVILAAAPLHVAYAQEARTYALTVLIAIMATHLFLRVLRDPTGSNQKLHVAYILAAALLLYCHLYGVFIVAAHQVAYLAAWASGWRRRGIVEQPGTAVPLKRWIVISVAIAALYSPWVPIVLQWMRAVGISFWVKRVTWDDISRAYWVLSGSTPLYVAALVLLVLGTLRLWRRQRAALPLLAALTLLPVIVPVFLSIIGRPSFAPRYAIVACVGYYPLLAAGVAAIPWAIARAGVLLLLVFLGVAALRGPAVEIPKAPWREAVEYVQEQAGPKDIVVIHIGAKKRMYDFYNRRPDLPVRRFDTGSLPLVPPLDPQRRIWFIRHEEWAPLEQQLRSGPWHVVSHKWFGEILVMELDDDFPEPSPAPPATTERAPTP